MEDEILNVICGESELIHGNGRYKQGETIPMTRKDFNSLSKVFKLTLETPKKADARISV